VAEYTQYVAEQAAKKRAKEDYEEFMINQIKNPYLNSYPAYYSEKSKEEFLNSALYVSNIEQSNFNNRVLGNYEYAMGA
jgi:hypothetical protein